MSRALRIRPLSFRVSRARAALGLVLAATTFSALPARAQGTSAEQQDAETRFREGLRRHDAGDEEGARISFLEAYSVLKRPNLLFNLARAEQLTGHILDAIAHYETFAADSTVNASDRETARARIVELGALVGHIKIEAPEGAELWIDGQPLPDKAPLREPADVSMGPHTIQARLGDRTKSTGVSCAAGQTVTAKLDIEAPPPVEVTPPLPAPSVRPELEPPVTTTSYKASAGKIGTTAALAGVAVAAIGTGVGFQLAATAKANDVTNDQRGGNRSSCSRATTPSCARLSRDASAKTNDENARTGAFIGAGAFAAAAVVVWVAWPNRQPVENAVHVVPLVSPGFAGFEFTTAF